MECVYVGNLPPDIRIKDIDDFFKPFGKLVAVDVNHRARPVYACVQFDNARNAFNAVKSRHGYDYEGYTLHLRFLENEVRKRRDATPPPRQSSMPGDYDQRFNNNNGFNNNYGSNNNQMGGNYSNTSFQSNSNSEWSNSNRGTGQQNMVQYPITSRLNRNNIQSQSLVPYSSMESSNSNYNTNYSQMEQNYSGSYRSDMPQQNMDYSNRSDFSQQNMNYSNINRSNMSQSQSMDMSSFSNNNSWNNKYEGAQNYNNDGSNDDSYTNRSSRDQKRGLSGCGRRWLNRYLQQGFSPETARTKALQHRNAPYSEEDTRHDQIPNNPRNAALETIGNSIMSLLSSNRGDQYNSKRRDRSFERPGPSSSNAGSRKPQTPRSAVSRSQYLKSLRILKQYTGKRTQSAKERISKRYHTQIVKDYEEFESKYGRKDNSTEHARQMRRKIITSSDQDKLFEMLRKKKGELLSSAKKLAAAAGIKLGTRSGSPRQRKRHAGAQKKRYATLMEAGFSQIEAECLVLHHMDDLKPLLFLKRECDLAKMQSTGTENRRRDIPKVLAYRNDLNYLNRYKKEDFSIFSTGIKNRLIERVNAIHKYEKRYKLPLSRGKLISFILKQKAIINEKANEQKKSEKKEVTETKNKTKSAITTKKEIEKNNKDTKTVDVKTENEGKKIKEDIEDVIDITEDQQDDDDGNNEEAGDCQKNVENTDDTDKNEEDLADGENADDNIENDEFENVDNVDEGDEGDENEEDYAEDENADNMDENEEDYEEGDDNAE